MPSCRRQRGFLLIAAIVLMVVLGFFAVVITYLFVGNLTAGADHLSSAKALFAAESGLERASFQLASGTACGAGLNGTNVALANASFTVVATQYPTGVTTTLSGAGINAATSIIPVGSVANYAPSGRIRIESEEINYTGTSTAAAVCGTAPCFTGAQRGVGGTTAAAHAGGIAVQQALCFIRSTGTFGAAQRIVEKSLHRPEVMMVYAKAAGDPVPYFRIWNSTTLTWGAEQTATSVAGGRTIRYMVLKFARTRNEAVLGTLSNDGAIHVQVWNGFTWSAVTNVGGTGAGNSIYRGFDIEYETANDRAVIVYNNNNRNPVFRTWSGGPNWSAAVGLNTSLGVANYPTANPPIWIELAANPLAGSSDLALITMDTAQDVYGARWNGTNWTNMGVAAIWDNTVTDGNNRKAIDVAYEQVSGRAMFIWTQAAPVDQHRYRIWNGAALSDTTFNIGNPPQADQGQWVQLAPRPGSNQMMYVVQDDDSDLYTALWSGPPGNVWTNIVEHDTAVEDRAARNFDIVFETHPARDGRAWLVWGRGTVTRTNAWTGAAWAGTADIAGSDDTNLVHLYAHPVTGSIFAGIYEDDNANFPRETREMHITGGGAAWSATTVIWGGDTNAVQDFERVFISGRRVIPIVWQENFP